MNNKNFALTLIICVLAIGGGLYYYMKYKTPAYTVPAGSPSAQNSYPDSNMVYGQSSYNTPPAISTTTTITTTTPAPAPVIHYVSIQNFAFNPSSLTVKKGDTVVWTNMDSAQHNVIGNTGGPNSGTLSKNQTYSYTFNSTGTFSYKCTFHPGMNGTIVVTS